MAQTRLESSPLHCRQIRVAHKVPAVVVMAGREGEDAIAQPLKILRLACESDAAVGEGAVVERTDPDGVARRDQAVLRAVVEDQRKLGVEPGEHPSPELLVQRQQQLAVGIAREGIAQLFQLLALFAPAVELAVAHDLARAAGEGLHAPLVEPHDGQPVEAQESARDRLDPRIVGAAGFGAVKEGPDLLRRIQPGLKTHDTAHKKDTSGSNGSLSPG